jgi:hypothetical protein
MREQFGQEKITRKSRDPSLDVNFELITHRRIATFCRLKVIFEQIKKQ